MPHARGLGGFAVGGDLFEPADTTREAKPLPALDHRYGGHLYGRFARSTDRPRRCDQRHWFWTSLP
jgi:hypothetical protein